MAIHIALPDLSPLEAHHLEQRVDDGYAQSGFIRQDPVTSEYYITTNSQEQETKFQPDAASCDDVVVLKPGFQKEETSDLLDFSGQCFSSDCDQVYAFRKFAQDFQCYFLNQPHRLWWLDTLIPNNQETFTQGCSETTSGDEFHERELRFASVNAYKMIQPWKEIFNDRFHSDAMNVAEREKALIAWIKDQDLDVVLFQEAVDQKAFERVKEETGYEHGFRFTDYAPKGVDSDLAILSRYPIKEAQFKTLPWYSSEEILCLMGNVTNFQFGIGRAVIDYEGTEVVIADVHNTHQEDPYRTGHLTYTGTFADIDDRSRERELYLIAMREFLNEDLQSGRPVIMAGDWNASYDSSEFGFEERVFPETEDVLLSAMFRGVSVYRDENQCAPYPDFVTFTEDNRIVAATDQSSQGSLDRIRINDGLRLRSVYIDSETDTFSDHSAVVARVLVRKTDEDFQNDGLVETRPWIEYIPEEQLVAIRDHIETVEIPSLCRGAGFLASRDIKNQRGTTLVEIDAWLAMMQPTFENEVFVLAQMGNPMWFFSREREGGDDDHEYHEDTMTLD